MWIAISLDGKYITYLFTKALAKSPFKFDTIKFKQVQKNFMQMRLVCM